MMSLHAVTMAVCAVCMAALAAGLPALARAAAEAYRGMRRWPFLAFFLLIACHAWFVKPRLPHNIWHEQHAVALYYTVEQSFGHGGMESMHGPTYSMVMRLARLLTAGELSPFSINYVFSSFSAAFFYLLLALLGGSPALAFTGGTMLLFLPTRMRLSTTESMFIMAECLMVLTVLLAALWAKTRRRGFAWLAGASMVLLTHERGEMMALAPALAAFCMAVLMLRGRIPRAWPLRGWALGLAGCLAVLALPRAVELVLIGDPRNTQWTRAAQWFMEYLGPRGWNVFFNPEYTPVFYPLLFVAGLAALFRGSKEALACLVFSAGFLTYYYGIHLSCVSLKVRTGLATQFMLVGVAACGAHGVAGLLGRTGGWVGRGALLALVAAAPLLRKEFLTTLYTSQQEFLFMGRAAEALPDKALVVYLADSDERDMLQNREWQRERIFYRARALEKNIVTMGVRRYLQMRPEIEQEDNYFYKGSACLTRLRTITDPDGRTAPRDPGYTDPLCLQMEREFVLEPVLERVVTNDSLSWCEMEGEERSVGLYKITGLRRPRRGLAAKDPKVAYVGHSEPWFELAFKARQARRPRLLWAALARAGSAPPAILIAKDAQHGGPAGHDGAPPAVAAAKGGRPRAAPPGPSPRSPAGRPGDPGARPDAGQPGPAAPSALPSRPRGSLWEPFIRLQAVAVWIASRSSERMAGLLPHEGGPWPFEEPPKETQPLKGEQLARLRGALRLWSDGRLKEGFQAYHQLISSSAPQSFWAVENYCREHASTCLPLRKATGEIMKLNTDGIQAFVKGDVGGAIRFFDKALELDPLDLDAMLNRAAVAAKRADYRTALACYDKAIALKPSGAGQASDALSSRAGVLLAMGRKAEASADFSKALAAAPKDWPKRTVVAGELARLRAAGFGSGP
ncbi:MAG: hypothetical protein HY927_09435 [Elusimicrobia bacterium]|nr:hypothetical protein [Elusimicrobiota bacterium]